MIKFLSVLLILAVSTAISFIPQSHAQESANSTAQYALELKQLEAAGFGRIHSVTYAMFYVTSQVQCTDSDYQRLKFYSVITDEYLSLYGLNHRQENAQCVSKTDFDKYFSAVSSTVTPIVIMDKTASQQLLIHEGNNGLYTISGIGSESILVCACDNDVESWSGAWILSHELSHLSLYRYGAPYSVYLTWVHYNEAMSYACKVLTQSNFCPEYSTTVISQSGNPIPVMEVFGQGATAYNMPSSPPQIDVPIIFQPIPVKELEQAVRIHISPPIPALNIISSVEVVGLKPLDIDGNLYPVPYNITGGIVQEFYADSFTKKLTIEVIGGINGGHLHLQLSRKIMDSIQYGNDTRFVITSGSIADENKKQLDYVETQTDPETRTLQITFPPNQTNIEITGTMIVPEFPLPTILLAISLGSMLAFYGIKLRK